jgi:hypothetical protein
MCLICSPTCSGKALLQTHELNKAFKMCQLDKLDLGTWTNWTSGQGQTGPRDMDKLDLGTWTNWTSGHGQTGPQDMDKLTLRVLISKYWSFEKV